MTTTDDLSTQQRFLESRLSFVSDLLKRWIPQSSTVFGLGESTEPLNRVLGNLHFATIVDLLEKDSSSNSTHWHQFSTVPTPDYRKVLAKEADIVFTCGYLQKLNDHHLLEAADFITKSIKGKGTLIICVPLDALNEAKETGFNRDILEYVALFENVGFTESYREIIDFSQPTGQTVHWAVLVFLRTEQREIAYKRFRTILFKDSKRATYKFALLRCLCEINMTSPQVVRYQDGKVCLPFGLIVEKWIKYFMILGENGRMPTQIAGNQQLKFRHELETVARLFGNNWTAVYRLLDSPNQRSAEQQKAIEALLNKTSDVIKSKPCTYITDEEGKKVFDVERKSRQKFKFTNRCSIRDGYGEMIFDAELWQELNCIAPWFNDSIVLEWARLTEHFEQARAKKDPTFAHYDMPTILDRLLLPENARDTGDVRSLYENVLRSQTLNCVWSGRKLTQKTLAVDHMMPWSWFHNNELWNLVPANNQINGQKSDSIPSQDQLYYSRDAIIATWKLLEAKWPSLFRSESEITLLRQKRHLPVCKWETPLFDSLLDYALNRSLQFQCIPWDCLPETNLRSVQDNIQ